MQHTHARYVNVFMIFADGSLVVLAENLDTSNILTLDEREASAPFATVEISFSGYSCRIRRSGVAEGMKESFRTNLKYSFAAENELLGRFVGDD